MFLIRNLDPEFRTFYRCVLRCTLFFFDFPRKSLTKSRPWSKLTGVVLYCWGVPDSWNSVVDLDLPLKDFHELEYSIRLFLVFFWTSWSLISGCLEAEKKKSSNCSKKNNEKPQTAMNNLKKAMKNLKKQWKTFEDLQQTLKVFSRFF